MTTKWRVAIRSLLAAGLAFSVACTGLLGPPTIHMDVSSAGGLVAGDKVILNGVEIGAVQAVTPTGSGARVELGIQGEHLPLLDSDTLFIVREANTTPPTHIVAASNICLDGAPRGLVADQTVQGYGGMLPAIVLSAGRDHPECTRKIVEQLAADLGTLLNGLE